VINSLVHQKLARSSKTPGKTKLLDFFLINNSFYFVDLPGYGFAHRSSEDREHFRKLMMWYFEYSEVKKRFVVHIVDSVVGLTEFDHQMIEYLQGLRIPFCIVANKIDKLKTGEQKNNIKIIQEFCKNVTVIPYSATENIGKSDLLKCIHKTM